ncbi:drug/metabolite transporter (DMT)-like permease [Neorhizobium huautlense]|uniref:Drug/metabolite transporter (DMT)-like permease n=1 Tax=Neorhizobium huautlense TaxID=67774 RepID=A0ABT9PUK8_9HYPH|nr:DMT family transporter [Neorhizobium huautlense]MDP9837399.1 drug/metabolite transporter (DMT)-like permease [Neorhizobium huautlense]
MTMIGLALFAAILHASWNAFLRSGADRMWSVTVMSISGTIVSVPLILIYPLPSPTALAFIIASSALQTAYSFILVAAYRYGDLGQVYPIVRGTVPLLVTLASILFLGVHLETPQIAGVALIATGIMSLVLGRSGVSPVSLGLALVCGSIISTYALIDSSGVRHVDETMTYSAWVLLIYGVMMVAVYCVMRGRLSIDFRSRETRKALGGGVFALIAYAAVVAAYSLGPAGPVTAIRETSVVFAVIIGRLFLGEALTPKRIFACVVVAAGAILIGR